jgi:ADP-ribosylglycohydrolase
MRCTPIPCFYSECSYEQIAECAKRDALLTHPSVVCQEVSALYCVAIAHLINNKGGRSGAIGLIENWPDVCPTVKRWLQEEPGDCTQCIGHARHAFTLALHCLRQNLSYEEAIMYTLMKGGDTDTNACIVGGMMGALHGISSIPGYMKDVVLGFDCSTHDPGAVRRGYQRPATYRAANVLQWFS